MAQWLMRASQGHWMYCPWSGGHEFDSRVAWNWDAWHFCLSRPCKKIHITLPWGNIYLWWGTSHSCCFLIFFKICIIMSLLNVHGTLVLDITICLWDRRNGGAQSNGQSYKPTMHISESIHTHLFDKLFYKEEDPSSIIRKLRLTSKSLISTSCSCPCSNRQIWPMQCTYTKPYLDSLHPLSTVLALFYSCEWTWQVIVIAIASIKGDRYRSRDLLVGFALDILINSILIKSSFHIVGRTLLSKESFGDNFVYICLSVEQTIIMGIGLHDLVLIVTSYLAPISIHSKNIHI